MWEIIGDFIGQVGFPIFVATYLLIGLKPELRKLRETITTLTIVTAKANGMKAKDVKEIFRLVTNSNNRNRRAEDRISDGFGKD